MNIINVHEDLFIEICKYLDCYSLRETVKINRKFYRLSRSRLFQDMIDTIKYYYEKIDLKPLNLVRGHISKTGFFIDIYPNVGNLIKFTKNRNIGLLISCRFKSSIIQPSQFYVVYKSVNPESVLIKPIKLLNLEESYILMDSAQYSLSLCYKNNTWICERNESNQYNELFSFVHTLSFDNQQY